MTDQRIRAIAQITIAAIIIGGWIFGILTNNPLADKVTPLVTLVIGYYFGVAVPNGSDAGGSGNVSLNGFQSNGNSSNGTPKSQNMLYRVVAKIGLWRVLSRVGAV